MSGVERGEIEELHKSWLGRCDMLSRRVTVECDGFTYVGRVLDISPLEGLILVLDRGPRIHLPARSTTVLG